MRSSYLLRSMVVTGLAISLSAVSSCGPARPRDLPLPRGIAHSRNGELGVTIALPRQMMFEGETASSVLSSYHHFTVSSGKGDELYSFITGPTSKDVNSSGDPTSAVELNRPVPTSAGNDTAVAIRVPRGGGYIRGTWPVPATRRVRGTTQTIIRGDTTKSLENTHTGGLVVYTDLTRDIVYLEPARGPSADPSVTLEVLRPNGNVQGVITLRSGFYYILTTNGNNTVISDELPWDSTGEPVPHSPVARAALDSIRNAAISSGISALQGLPPLLGP